MQNNRQNFKTPLKLAAAISALVTPSLAFSQAECVPNEAAIKSQQRLNWVPKGQMTDAQLKDLNGDCCGKFIEPEATWKGHDDDASSAPVYISSDKGGLKDGGQKSQMSGDVTITQGSRKLRADDAAIDRANNTATLSGNVTIRDPGVVLIGDKASVNMSAGASSIEGAEFVLYDTGLNGSAAKVAMSKDNTLTLTDGRFTTCAPGSKQWELRSDSIVLDNETGLGTTKNASFNLGGVPVLYIPWASFPIDQRRTTGMLVPAINFGSDGFDVSVPVYINLAPNYDTTITPRYIADRGTGVEAEFRYLNDNFETKLSGAYWGDDKLADRKRWLKGIQLDSNPNYQWYVNVDYTDVSDIDYFRDMSTAGLDVSSETNLEQSFTGGYRFDNWDVGMQLQRYMPLTESISSQYQQVPHLYARGQYATRNGISISLDSNITQFKDYEGDSNTDGWRTDGKYTAAWQLNSLAGFVKPSAGVRFVTYNLNNPVDEHNTTTPGEIAPSFTLDSGMFFESSSKHNLQTFEPRIYYTYVDASPQNDQPNFDTSQPVLTYQNLYEDTRFAGSDRIGDNNRVTIGGKYSLVSNETGEEWFVLGVAQGFYASNRYVTLEPRLTPEVIDHPERLQDPSQAELEELDQLTEDQTDLMFDSQIRLNNVWSLDASVNVDDTSKDVSRATSYLRYSKTKSYLINLGYIYEETPDALNEVTGEITKQDIQQFDISAYIPLKNDKWSVFGRWNYDMTNAEGLDILAGFEYRSCCWRVGVAYQNWVDSGSGLEIEDQERRTAIKLQFELIGLSNNSSSVDNLLSSIYGYDNYSKKN